MEVLSLFWKKLGEIFLVPLIPLISCSVYSRIFVSFRPYNTNIKQLFLANWVMESFSSVFIVVGMISLK